MGSPSVRESYIYVYLDLPVDLLCWSSNNNAKINRINNFKHSNFPPNKKKPKMSYKSFK